VVLGSHFDWLGSFAHFDSQCLESDSRWGKKSSGIEGWQIPIELVVASVEHSIVCDKKLVQ
jgi:hypothetical protein